MKTTLLFLIISSFAFPKTHESKGTSPNRNVKQEPQQDMFFAKPTGKPLTAQEAESGAWIPDEEGGCDLEKGCAYKNKDTGEVRYLPDAEKKKLRAKKEDSATESSKSQKITELKDKMSWDEKFETEKNKKKLVLIFSAEDCGPCKALKAKLEKVDLPEVGLYSAVRPSYRSVQGHPLHEAFQKSIGGSVPVAFIYTQDENGKWIGKVAKGNQIFPAISP